MTLHTKKTPLPEEKGSGGKMFFETVTYISNSLNRGRDLDSYPL